MQWRNVMQQRMGHLRCERLLLMRPPLGGAGADFGWHVRLCCFYGRLASKDVSVLEWPLYLKACGPCGQ